MEMNSPYETRNRTAMNALLRRAMNYRLSKSAGG
jgi:hypothetical protein